MTLELVTFDISFSTSGDTDVVDLTRRVLDRMAEADIEDGQVLLFVPGSTGALTTIEYEHGAVSDLKEAIENLAPEGRYYHHNERWGDGNGHAHVRAALLGPSLTIPAINGRLQLGTWQQIVFIDFDNRPRQRRVIMQVSGRTRKKRARTAG